ncbi:MAG: hypothetical protein LQ348_005354 [Seirophora lacunosa]|nr:MAG: hypothetical protein LQ344_000731 [Seirophora lacunosa]KAI4179675.1 MAG: hypothetical protein LQ348_005354 [Seirophora lacunosa]
MRQESSEVSGSKGEANFVWRCKACKRESTASIKDHPKTYTQESPPTRQTIIEIDCRGLEFIEFRADVWQPDSESHQDTADQKF